MFSLTALLALTIATVAAAIACALTLATHASWPQAMLAALATFVAALGIVPTLLKHDDS